MRAQDEDWEPERFRALLQELLDRTELNQQQLGELAGRSRSQANRWLRAENQPEYGPLRRLVDGLAKFGPEAQRLGVELLEAAGYSPPDSTQQARPVDGRPPSLTEALAMVRAAIEASEGTLSDEERQEHWARLRQLEEDLLFGLRQKRDERRPKRQAEPPRRAAEN